MPNNNPWFASTMALGGLIVGYLIANGMNGVTLPTVPGAQPPSSVGAPAPAPSNDEPADVDDDEVLGESDAEITLIEFTDYQCPFCSRHYEQTYKQIKENYIDTGKVKLVVRDFPLSFHQHAQKAAEATECAADQGKFWEMHDKLFETQAEWTNASDGPAQFKEFAQELGLDTGDFDSCLDNGTHAKEVTDDMADGSASGIDGTPGFWILGPNDQNQKISGAYPYATFQSAFDNLLK